MKIQKKRKGGREVEGISEAIQDPAVNQSPSFFKTGCSFSPDTKH
jgi:hypothetical protein